MGPRVFPTTELRSRAPGRELVAVACAFVCMLVFGLLAGCDAPAAAHSTHAAVRATVAVEAGPSIAVARKSVGPRSRKALEEDDDDDGTAPSATCVRSHPRQIRAFALAPNALALPVVHFVDPGAHARGVASGPPRKLILATHDARGPPRA